MLNTLHLDASDPARREEAISAAAALLREGKRVVIPTETVYGLAANGLDSAAVKSIFAAKGRPSDNPLILHIASFEELSPLVRELPPQAGALARAFWPGPLTMVLPKSAVVPAAASGGLDTVAVRMPAHPVARAIIRAAGLPLAAPSANLSGSPSPTTPRHCYNDMDGRVEAIVAAGDCEVGVESTVVSFTGEGPVILRPGAVTAADIAGVAGEARLHESITAPLGEGQAAASPGMKYRHYAPKARVVLVRGSRAAYRDYVNARRGEGVYALCFEEDGGLELPALCYGRAGNAQSQAHGLFDALRELDARGAGEVYAHAPDCDGLGLAVYNRLLRAAAFRVIEL